MRRYERTIGSGRLVASGSKNGSGNRVGVWEFPPQRRTILANREYFLSLPFTIFVIEYSRTGGLYHHSSCQVFFRNQPFQSDKDLLVSQPLGNSDMDGKVCWGEARVKAARTPQALARQVIDAFWSSRFDSTMRYFKLGHRSLQGLAGLHTASAQDHEVGVKIEWERLGHTTLQKYVHNITYHLPPERARPHATTSRVRTRPRSARDVPDVHLPGGLQPIEPAAGEAGRDSPLPAEGDDAPLSWASTTGIIAGQPPQPQEPQGNGLPWRQGLPASVLAPNGAVVRAQRRRALQMDGATGLDPLPTAEDPETSAEYLLGRQVCRVLMTMTYQLTELAKGAGDAEGRNEVSEIEERIAALGRRYDAALPDRKF